MQRYFLKESYESKEDFLLDLEEKAEITTYVDDGSYKIIGLPFYTHNVDVNVFKDSFNKKLLDED